MKFVPLSGTNLRFCIWPTRVRDFAAFAKATKLKTDYWTKPGFEQGPDHPVVNVSWEEAVAFCKWLTQTEREKGLIATKETYRLPGDLEWSRAVGLGEEPGATPEQRDLGVPDVYPWGKAWPPPVGAGNYSGEETDAETAMKGYNDGFICTSPVGSFPANKFGLYDMGGNVWQWCLDWWNAESKNKVARGASWYNGALKLSLLSSCRVHAPPNESRDNYGFRVVVADEPGKESSIETKKAP
jgi:formylglycine-generating enzyme required for sulfatase activity